MDKFQGVDTISNKRQNCIKANEINEKILFYQTPKLLFTKDKYRPLGMAEKQLYAILRDRLSLSLKNGWIDDEGYVFLYFKQNKLSDLTGVSRRTISKYLKNLMHFDLIVIENQGANKPNKMYIKNLELEPLNAHLDGKIFPNRTGRNFPSGREDFSHHGGKNFPTNETEYNYTEFNDTEKNIIQQIKNLRLRYSEKQLKIIDEYFDILKWTRKGGHIAKSVILKIYKKWTEFKIGTVIYAISVYIQNPKHHDKKENYCYGIMRNATSEQIAEFFENKKGNGTVNKNYKKPNNSNQGNSFKTRFHNFEQRTSKYTPEELEKMVRKRKAR